MLLKFTSKSAPSVLMLSEHALPVLIAAGKKLDHEMTERGVFTPDQLQDAVASLAAAMQEAPDIEEHKEDEEEDEFETKKVHPLSLPVGFKQRAYPLFSMMEAALKDGNDVMWEPESSDW